jgi:hypothetical protein
MAHIEFRSLAHEPPHSKRRRASKRASPSLVTPTVVAVGGAVALLLYLTLRASTPFPTASPSSPT